MVKNETAEALRIAMKTAMNNRSVSDVKHVLARGYKASQVLYEDTRETALHHAARYFDVEMCQIFIDAGAKVNAKDKYRATPLDIALEQGRAAGIVATLAAAGANVNQPDVNGVPPLHRVALRDNSSEKKMFDSSVCQVLLDHGAHLYALSEKASTPLHVAETLDAWRFFVAAGISIDYVPQHCDASYLTPFQDVVRVGRADLVAYCLAQGGIDLNQRTLGDCSLSDLATSFDVRAALRAAESVEAIETVIDVAASPRAQLSREECNPL